MSYPRKEGRDALRWFCICFAGEEIPEVASRVTLAEMMAYSCGTAAHDPTSWIEILPDEILLEIFDCLRLAITQGNSSEPWKWHRLAHVCQRWRNLIFESPRRLDLRLVYIHVQKPA